MAAAIDHPKKAKIQTQPRWNQTNLYMYYGKVSPTQLQQQAHDLSTYPQSR